MIFRDPRYFHLLWLLPLLILFYIWVFRSKRKALEKFAHTNLIQMLTPTVNWRIQKLKAMLIILAVVFMIFALAGPRWGFQWQEVKRQGIDIIVAIDTSRSMLAQDVLPNRLERSKLAVKDLLELLQGDRIGLIAFAGSSFLQCPLTMDYGAFAIALNSIDTSIIPRGGTSIGSAIETATTAFEGKAKQYKALIMITDGEDHEGDPIKASEEADRQGIKIFCVGVGTREGELIPVVDEIGNRSFLKDREGQVVKSRLDETTLQKIALNTGGGYVRASGAEYGLDIIYKEKIAAMEKRDIESKLQKRYEERYQIPAAIALCILCLQALLGERKRGVRRDKRHETQDSRRKIGNALFLLCALALASCIISWVNPHADRNKDAIKLYNKERYDEALTKYNEVLVELPNSPYIHFNIGNSEYKKENYEEAIKSYTKAISLARDTSLEGTAYYNLGNCKYRQGKLKENTNLGETISLYRESLDYYKQALDKNPEDTNAKYNHEFVERKIKELLDKQKQQQNQQGNQQEKSAKEDKSESQEKTGEQANAQTAQAEQKEQKGQEGKQGQGEQKEGLTAEEARMLLDSLKDEELSRLQIRDKERRSLPQVLKDW